MASALRLMRTVVAGAASVSVVGLAVGCGGGGGGSASTTPPGSGANSPPVIAGQPPLAVRVGEPYTFRPSASDPNGDALTFAATNLPPWASLDADTGRVSGTPDAVDEGIHESISISVSDGRASASLGPFSIAVTQTATGAVTLSWLPPTQNADGTPLMDLAGYRIQYGRDAEDLRQSVSIVNPSVNTYLVEQLSAGTWYFAVFAVRNNSIESLPSVVVSKTIG